MTKNLKGFGYSVLAMKRALSWILVVLLGALAQQVQLPNPSGPVVEARSPSVEATLRLQGCTRDQGGQVVCSLQVQSTARTNQQVTVLHQSVRAISARGFSYPGYLVADGGKVEGNRSTFALPAGARVAARLIFPKVPQEETAFAAVFVGGVEFRGIPIGPQVVQGGEQRSSQQPSPSAAGPKELVIEDWRSFQVGSVQFNLTDGCKVTDGYGGNMGRLWNDFQATFFNLSSWRFIVCTYTVVAKEDTWLDFEFPDRKIVVLNKEGSAMESNWGGIYIPNVSTLYADVPQTLYLGFVSPNHRSDITQIFRVNFFITDRATKTKARFSWSRVPVEPMQ